MRTSVPACAAACLLLTAWACQALAATTTRVSVSSGGTAAATQCFRPSLSADGRYVAFVSAAANLVSGDTNGKQDVFLHDRQGGQTVRVSVSSAGGQGNGDSDCPAISADGLHVAFYSAATDLVAGDTNDQGDIFVHHVATGVTERASVSGAGTQADDLNCYPSLSSDGRQVAFISWATNLVDDDTNGDHDVYLRDLAAGTTERISVSSDEAEGDGPSSVVGPRCVSGDGRYVVFCSLATNLVSGDSNNWPDVFVRDRSGGVTTRVSVSSTGSQGNGGSGPEGGPSISGNGRYVVFTSGAGNLAADDDNWVPDVFIHDCVTGATSRVSLSSSGAEGEAASGENVAGAVSSDGRYVAFTSAAANLVANDTNSALDVFVRDRQTSKTTRVSLAGNGTQGGGDSGQQQLGISDDGTCVAFSSLAIDLVSSDGNGCQDIFVRETPVVTPEVVTWSPRGTGIARTAALRLTFSVPMQRGSVENNLTLLPARAGTFAWQGRRLTFTPSLPWLAGKRYRVTISAAARSSAGVRLGRAFTWSFQTVAAGAAPVSVAARPAGEGASLSVALAAPAVVTVTIRNLAGRPVAVLRPGDLAPGVRLLLWEGRSIEGTLVPAGSYLAEVEALAADGTQHRAVTLLLLGGRRR